MLESCRAVFSFLAHHLGFWHVIFWVGGLVARRPLLAVFTFHRVVDSVPDARFLLAYERGQPLALHARQIDALSRYFRIVDLDRFRDVVTGRVAPRGRRPLALITYDDADGDQARVAFPLLHERGVPAVAFVPTGFIGTSRRFYHCRLTNICNQLTARDYEAILGTDLPADVNSVLREFAGDFDTRRPEVCRRLLGPLSRMVPEDRDRLLDQWEGYLGGRYELGIGCMTWDAVTALAGLGISVGSHTISHNRLALLGEEEIRREVSDSKSELEQRLGRPVDAICYPEGSCNDAVLQAVRRAGYTLGFANACGLVPYPLDDAQRLLIPRIGAGVGSVHRMCYVCGRLAIRQILRLRGHGRRPRGRAC